MYVTEYDNIAFIWLQKAYPFWNKCPRCSPLYKVQIIFMYIYITVRFRGKTKKCRITLAFMRCFVVFRRKWINTGQEFRSMYMNKKRSHYCQNSSVVRCYGDKNKRENTLLKHSMNEIYSLHRITITIWLLEKR